MTSEPGGELDSDLDRHLDRLMESAYAALAGPGAGVARSEPPLPPERPERIGPYQVLGLLGRGGTSLVWKALDPDLGREIAIKVVDPRHAPGGTLARRFLDEARLCGRLAHPGIVPIYGMGQLPDGRPWFTMRLVEGETLAELLGRRGELGERQQHFLEVFARTCETVAFAHARGVVHGDLKPGNVMVGTYGQVQVVDWGFSRLVAEPSGGQSDGPSGAPNRGMGTPAFMAPEQAQHGNAAIDARTDVFGLGAILGVILTGKPPFTGGSRSEIHVRAAQGDLAAARERLQSSRADVELVRLALDCLAAQPAERPADAAAVAARLSAWFVSIEQRAHRLELAAAQAAVEAREQRRTRTRTVALAALVVALVGVYVWMRFERQGRDYESRTAVVQAIERARSRHAGAEIAGDARIRWLGEAALAAQQAKTFAATVADPTLQAQATELAQLYQLDHDTAVADEKMAHWLEDFPSHLDLTRDQLDDHYAAGFRDYGIDVATLEPGAAAERLRARPIAPALARALDDWGFVRRLRPGVAAAEWRSFHELALAVDVDPQRTAVRQALLADDTAALLRLVDDPACRDAGSDTLDLLANGLDRAGERAAAIRVWQHANARHPADVRVIHSLAVHHFSEPGCPPWAEIVRLFTAGTALRPNSAHLWTDLAHALLGAGDIRGADAAMQRAQELDPRDERAHASRIDLLRCRCCPVEALAHSAALAERADDGPAWRVHGDAQLVDGHVGAAIAAYRRAIVHEPTAPHHERLGQALLAIGDADAAQQALVAAVAADSHHAGAHVHLGLALRARGRFADAIDALERGQDLGGEPWAARCSQWLAETEHAAGFEAMARGEAPLPATGVAQAQVATVAHLLGDAVRAATLFRDAFAADPAVADGSYFGWHLDRAARAAAAAAAATTDATAVAWRDQAVTWFGLVVARLRAERTAGRERPTTLRIRLATWQRSPGFADVSPRLRAELDELTRAIAADPTVVVHAPFTDVFTYRQLARPDGVLAPFGGMLLEANDPDVLLVSGHAQRRTASVFAVGLQRDAAGHVEGFRGAARRLAAAPFADGGLVRGPRGVLVYTRYPNAEIGVIRPGAPGPELVTRLAAPTAGGFGFVPAAMPGGGRAKLLAWPGGRWFDTELAIGADRVDLATPRQVVELPGGPDGFVFVPGGQAPFAAPSVVVAEWSAHAIAVYELDANGDPVPATRRLIASGCRGVLGLATDPATGDLLVSTWRGDGTEDFGVLVRRGP
jgi:eukaryotic-like serine/threonine-protein kinase